MPRDWRAQLELGFCYEAGATRLTLKRHNGPLRVQRPFFPEGAALSHVYILHPPGGIVGGDALDVSITLAQNAAVLCTTPGATKVYRSAGRTSRVSNTLKVAAEATLEWLPQETLVYDGARLEACTKVELDERAAFFGWDINCMGRPGAGEPFVRGAVRQRMEIWRQGTLLIAEQLHAAGNDPLLRSAWGLQGKPVFGSCWCTVNAEELLTAIRARIGVGDDELFAATQMRGLLICRYIGASTERARHVFEDVWHMARRSLNGRDACIPRVWNT